VSSVAPVGSRGGAPGRGAEEGVGVCDAGGRDVGGVAEASGDDVLDGSRGVVEGLTLHVEAHGVERELALGERLLVGDDPGEELPAYPQEPEEAVMDGELDLATMWWRMCGVPGGTGRWVGGAVEKKGGSMTCGSQILVVGIVWRYRG
jgi:hypothetical protein